MSADFKLDQLVLVKIQDAELVGKITALSKNTISVSVIRNKSGDEYLNMSVPHSWVEPVEYTIYK